MPNSNGIMRIRTLLGWTWKEFKATWTWKQIITYWPVYMFWAFSLSFFFTDFVWYLPTHIIIFEAIAVIMLKTSDIRVFTSFGFLFLSILIMAYHLFQKNTKTATRFGVYIVMMVLWAIFFGLRYSTCCSIQWGQWV
jgi:hypothetical protein